MVKPSRQRASAHVVLFCAATAIDDAGAEINCDVCHTSFCMKPNLIVWDLETVPDLNGFAAANISSASASIVVTREND